VKPVVVEQMDDRNPMDLRTLVAVIWARRRWVAISMVVVTIACAAIAFLMKPVYRASVVFVSATAGQSNLSGPLGSVLDSLGGLASQAGINLTSSADTSVEETLAVLKSRQFTTSFIIDKDLMPKLYAKKWDAAAHKWKVPLDDQPTQARAFKKFDEKIRTVDRDKKSGLVTMQIDWTDRFEAADWANEMVRRVNAEMRARAIRQADDSMGYLEKELSTTSEVETREAINKLIESQVKQRMLANVTPDYAFRVVDKAVAPDSDDPIRPQKVALLIAGPLAGFALGVAWVLAYRALQDPSRGRQTRRGADV
jgi:uncharacterized protein involved in exopolysaccharide biosynthesis